ncbi:MAG: sulfatase-like hydrolase/transferase [Bacilli bacterium]|nr:sulfatase-like hydrolase/transferase [Bacilli bacterium]
MVKKATKIKEKINKENIKEVLNKDNIKEKGKNFLPWLKTSTKTYFTTNILFLTFIVTSIINEWLLRSLTVKNMFAIKPIISDITILLLIGAFGYLIKPKKQFRYFFGWSIFFTILCLINSMYYTNYVSYASFSLLETSLQIVDVGDAVVQNVMEIKDFCYLWQILAMFFVNKFLKRKKYFDKVEKIENGKVRAINTIIASIVFLFIFMSMLTSVDVSRLNKQWNRESIVMEFGAYTYQFNDLIATIKSELNPLFGYDKNAKDFREFYQNRNTEDKVNDYTGIFEGKNVLVIHAESIQNFLLNTSFNGIDVTPNLKRLASEGLYFSNFHSQESVGTSSDTEFTFSTSLMPASSGTVFISYYDRSYPTIEKFLKEKNYYTFSMHGNNCTFWNRQATHKSFGYDNFYCYTKDFEIDETIGLGLSDKSFFRQVVPKLKGINDKYSNWYGLLIMLSNHTPFTDIENYSDYKVTMTYSHVNEDGTTTELEAPFMEGRKLGSYFKSAHYADEALGQLMDDLDKEGLLDNTVVVIYGDHDAKLKKSEYLWYYNYNPETNTMLDSTDPNYRNVDFYDYELNREVPFIIWTKESKGNKLLNREITEAMGMYDVLPTLGNMVGFKDKYALGTDMMSLKDGDENIVVFPDGNWLTNKIYYNQGKGEYKVLDENAIISNDYIEKNSEIASKYISISNSIIVYDMVKKEEEKVGN